MAFMMNVSSCQVTSVTGNIGAKAAQEVGSLVGSVSTNTSIIDNANKLGSVIQNQASFASTGVAAASVQHVGSALDTNNKRTV